MSEYVSQNKVQITEKTLGRWRGAAKEGTDFVMPKRQALALIEMAGTVFKLESRVAEVEKERDRAVGTVDLQTALNSKLEDKITNVELRVEELRNTVRRKEQLLSDVQKEARTALAVAQEIVGWFEFVEYDVSEEANYRGRLEAIEKSFKNRTEKP